MRSVNDSHDIGKLLTSGRVRAGVWGLGYIGHSTFAALIHEGVRTVGFDIDRGRVTAARSLLMAESTGSVTDDESEILLEDVAVHFVAVPTERQDRPSNDAIIDVFTRIVSAVAGGKLSRGVLVVVESTLAPGTTHQVLIPLIKSAGLEPDDDVLVALAPRRDWLTFGRDGLRTLDRVFGGIGPRSTAAARGTVSVMTDTLHEARTHAEAELVKCVENAFRHLDVTFANQLTLAFPDVDMVDVLRLAATKWNMNEYQPSFGTGGYCIPLAGRYLLLGAPRPQELSLVVQALSTDGAMRERVVASIADQGPVLVLGLAYKGNTKVATLSPAIAMARRLRELSVAHWVHDPLYTPAEIEEISGSAAPEDLGAAIAQSRTVLVVTDHDAFLSPELLAMLTAPRGESLSVIDNYGVLSTVAWPEHVHYHRAGGRGWLAPTESGLLEAAP